MSRALPDRFVVRRIAGRGRHGEVFVALDRAHGVEVAVKRLHHVDGTSLRALKREVDALADRRHPNLVAIHELTVIDEQWLLVMEAIDGQPLDAWAGRDPDRWRHAIGGVTAGLEVLHEVGFLHHDLAAHNVWVTSQQRVVLLDLGLTIRLGTLDGRMGDVDTVSPEQLEGQPLTAASDWYALGAMLFRGWAGRAPFVGRGARVLAERRTQAPPSLSSLAPDTPLDLAELADGLLRRDPAARMAASGPRLRAFGGRGTELSELPFVGRVQEQRALVSALASAVDRTVHVRIEGHSGMGKTALVEHFAAEVPSAIVGRAHAAHAFPFAGLDALVTRLLARHPDVALSLEAPHRATVAAAFGWGPTAVERPRDPDTGHERLTHALRTLLVRVQSALDTPLVLVLDDAQWADLDAMRVLARTLGSGQLPALLVTTARPDETSDALRFLDARLPPSVRVSPSRLDAEAIAQLARAAHRSDGARIEAATDGVPLFVVSMAAGAEGESLEQALSARIDRLPTPERRTLQLLALAARPLERGLLLEASARAGIEHPLAALRGILAERVASARHEEVTTVELTHAAFARAALQAPMAPGSTVLHAAIDDGMEALGIDEPESQARHALGAHRPARGGAFLRRAARRAFEASAFDHAARLADQALQIVEAPPIRRELERLAGDALAAVGRGREAADAYARALGDRVPRVSDPDTIELARARAEQLLHAGRLPEGYAASVAVLRAVGLDLPSPKMAVAELVVRQLRLRLLPTRRTRVTASVLAQMRLDTCFSIGIALSNVDSVRAAVLVLRSLHYAAGAGDPERYARSLAYVAAFSCNGGERRAGFARNLIARSARAAADPFSAAMVEAARSLLAFHRGRYAESLARTTELEVRFASIPFAVRERVTARIYRCASLAMMGDFDALEVHRARLLEDAEARGDRFAMVNAESGVLNLGILARRGASPAREAAARASARWGDSATTVQHFFDLLAQSRIDLFEGDVERAVARIDAQVPALGRAFLLRTAFVRCFCLDVRARAELQRRAPSLRRVERAARALRREGSPIFDAMAAQLEAGLHHCRRDHAAAKRQALAAAAIFEAHRMAAHAAASRAFIAPADVDPGLVRALGLGWVHPVRVDHAWTHEDHVTLPTRQ